ncbi:MAG TPA: MFS transporter [Candidatus Limnocylindrales bacterium]|nr:MFS transporter [Candidatus Limnocylindrales bacterium]
MSTLPFSTHRQSLTRSVAASGAAVAGIMAVAHVANDAMTSMLSGLLPSLQVRLGLSEAVLAMLVATLAFSSSVTQPLFGALSDRFGARRVAAAGTAFGVSMMSLMTVAPGPVALFALLLVGGLGSAAFHPAGTSVVGAAPLTRRELAVGLFSAGGTLGLALGPLLVLGVAATVGLGFTPWLVVPAVVLGAAMFVLVPDQARTERRERTPILDRSLLLGPVGGLSLAAMLGSVPFVSFSAGFPLLLVQVRGIDPTDPLLGLVLAVFNGAAAVGAVAAAAMGSRIPAGVLVPVTFVAGVVPLAGLLLLPLSAVGILALAALAGALLNAGLPAMLVRAHDLAPHRRAAASGMLMGLPMGLAGIAYIGVGWLQETVGVVPALGVAFAMALPAAIVAAVVLRRTAGADVVGATAASAGPLTGCRCSAVG